MGCCGWAGPEVPFGYENHRYYFSTDPKTFADARAYCQSEYGSSSDLVVYESYAQMKAIKVHPCYHRCQLDAPGWRVYICHCVAKCIRFKSVGIVYHTRANTRANTIYELADPYNATINVKVKLCHQFWEEKGRGVVLQQPVCLVLTTTPAAQALRQYKRVGGWPSTCRHVTYHRT